MDDLWNDRLGVRDDWVREIEDGEEYHFVRYHSWLPELRPSSTEPTPERVGQFLVDRLTPVVDEVRHQSRLGKAALWRLLTDALAASYLNTGKRLGKTAQAMARATAIIEATGKPLANPLWHFKEYSIDATASPTGRAIRDWFRVRGGCCRYDTLPDSDYCGTCVHLDEFERRTRFERHLFRSAVPEDNP